MGEQLVQKLQGKNIGTVLENKKNGPVGSSVKGRVCLGSKQGSEVGRGPELAALDFKLSIIIGKIFIALHTTVGKGRNIHAETVGRALALNVLLSACFSETRH